MRKCFAMRRTCILHAWQHHCKRHTTRLDAGAGCGACCSDRSGYGTTTCVKHYVTLVLFHAISCIKLVSPDYPSDLQSTSEQDGLKLLRQLRDEGKVRGFGGGRQVC
jgi:hypothetical protein